MNQPGTPFSPTPLLPLSVLQEEGQAGQSGDVSTVESADGSTDPTATGTGTPAPGWLQIISNPIFPLILLFVVFYAFIIGGNRKKDRARKELLSSLSRGDRVTTIGGIIGNVVDATDDEVVVKIDENTNTKMRFARSAIASVTRAGDEKK